MAIAVAHTGARAAVRTGVASRTRARPIVTDAMTTAVVRARPCGAVRLREALIAHALQRHLVARAVAGACILARLARAFLCGTVSSRPSHVAEAVSIITDAVPTAVVLALSDLAVVSGPALLARAGPVEAVAVVAHAVTTLNQSAVTAVEARVASTAPTCALAVSVAVGGAAQADGARRPA